MFTIKTDSIRPHYAQNTKGLRQLWDKAVRSGKKVNGYTAIQLEEMTLRYEAMSKAPNGSRVLRKGETY